ncbi:MAG: nucleotidyltransferase domain-containing protein [Bacteroides sp.]|nr:nucleotidyltransferase domain-containing protein [Bacteroides sp.]
MRHTFVINKIADLMKRLFPEAKTVLYGSQARNTARMDSDIDLLILLPDTYKDHDFVRRRSEICNHLYDIEIDDTVPISPLVLTKGVWESRVTPFTINIQNEGIVL